MAGVGHIAVGMAAARVSDEGRAGRWASLALWSALSLLPDADVMGFAFGVDYADTWGHRGATHSLAASVALGLGIGIAARWFGRPPGRTAFIASVVLVSHAVLDTLTDGGLGCALFWPFSNTRYFAPWRPLPVAPIGLDFFSPYGGIIALTEVVLFGPLLLFALRRRRIDTRRFRMATGFLLVFWLMSVWLIASGDRAREAIVGFLAREDTAYASGFSEQAFRTIQEGDVEKVVHRLLGAPLSESWFYTPNDQPFQGAADRSALPVPGECLFVRFESRVVVSALDVDACVKRGIESGMSPIDVSQRLGAPPEVCWQYTRSPGGRHFRLRTVCFLNGRVATVFRQWQ